MCAIIPHVLTLAIWRGNPIKTTARDGPVRTEAYAQNMDKKENASFFKAGIVLVL